MELLKLQPQPPAEPLDAETLAALDEADASIARGEFFTLDEVRESIKERSKAWRKIQQPVTA
jgi:hypothetical protein